jgi:CheY-like chemotaxis protein
MAPVILVAGSSARGDVLRDSGFDVVQPPDAAALLELAAERPAPGVIVLELGAPGFDALDLCRQLKGNPDTRRIAVLIATDQPLSTEASIEALAAGADWCLAQPAPALRPSPSPRWCGAAASRRAWSGWPTKSMVGRRRRWRRSATSPSASPTTSTTS